MFLFVDILQKIQKCLEGNTNEILTNFTKRNSLPWLMKPQTTTRIHHAPQSLQDPSWNQERSCPRNRLVEAIGGHVRKVNSSCVFGFGNNGTLQSQFALLFARRKQGWLRVEESVNQKTKRDMSVWILFVMNFVFGLKKRRWCLKCRIDSLNFAGNMVSHLAAAARLLHPQFANRAKQFSLLMCLT